MNIAQFRHLPAIPLGTGDDMTPEQFRRSFGVPVSSLPHVRESLAMEREAMREVYGDHWRDSFAEIAGEFHDDDDDESGPDSLIDWEGDRESLALVRGFSARLTFDNEGEGGE